MTRARRWSVETDWPLVIAMAIASTLSAVCVWQAGEFEERAEAISVESALAEAQAAQRDSMFRTLVDHDAHVLTDYCAAVLERDAALVSFLGRSTDADLAPALRSETRRSSLQGLLQQVTAADPCASTSGSQGYDLDIAREVQAFNVDFTVVARPGDEGPAKRSQLRLLLAAVLFASALALFGIHEVAQAPIGPGSLRRLRALLPRVAVGALVAGAAVLVVETPRRDLLTRASVAAIALFLPLPWVARRVTRVGSPLIPRSVRDHVAARRTRWWAELGGSLTIVAVACSVVGLQMSFSRERDAADLARRRAAEAQEMIAEGAQIALRDTVSIQALADLDSQRIAAHQPASADPAEARRLAALRAPTEHELAQSADVLAAQLAADRADDPARVCPISSPREAVDADAMLAAQRASGGAIRLHLLRGTRSGVECQILAAFDRERAAAWGARASQFTLSLVLLGLAAFMLALAADGDRSRTTAAWLLRVGVLGAAVGIALAVWVPISRGINGRDGPTGQRTAEFAGALAAGADAVIEGDCDEARAQTARAISAIGDDGPARRLQYYAAACSPSYGTAPGPGPDPTAALRHIERAAQLGPVDSAVLTDLGFGRFVDAIQREDRRGLERSIEASRSAIELAAAEGEVTKVAQVARFNVAVAQLALGDGEALRTYEEAIECLSGARSCPGGSFDNEKFRRLLHLFALADLELLEGTDGGSEVERVRELLVTGSAAQGAPRVDSGGWELRVRPRQLGLFADEADDRPISIVWYVRPSGDDVWVPILRPSLNSWLPDQNRNLFWSTDAVLPAGDYRADVYLDGALAHRLHAAYDAGVDLERVVVPELGLSVAIPPEWERKDDGLRFGLEASFGPRRGSPLLFVRREEGALPTGDLERWATSGMDAWVAERLAGGVVRRGEVNGGAFLLGYPGVNRVYQSPDTVARGWAGFSSYATQQQCGGTLFGALIVRQDPSEEAARLFEAVERSLVLDVDPLRLPTLEDRVEGSGFSVVIPNGWSAAAPAAGTSGRFVIRDCRTGVNVLVSGEEITAGTSVDAYAEAGLESLRSGAFPEFELITRRRVELASDEVAVILDYTWTSDGLPIRQRQLYALGGSRGFVMTFTAPARLFPSVEATSEDVLESFRVVASV